MAKFCKNCGQQMEDDDLFCDACGSEYKEEGNIEFGNGEISELQIYEEKIRNCKDKDLLEVIRDDVEKNVLDAYDKKYLVSLIDATCKAMDRKVQIANFEMCKEKVARCESIEGALELNAEIKKGDMSEREKYWLLRQLKEKITEVYSSQIAIATEMEKKDYRAVWIGLLITSLCSVGMFKLISLIKITWIQTICGWIINLSWVGVLVCVILYIVSAMKWKKILKGNKEEYSLYERIKNSSLYFDKNAYIFYDSDIRYLKPSEIDRVYKDLASMEILARHGKKYDNAREDIRNHFERREWYKDIAARKVVDSDLNKYEVANYNLLQGNKPEACIKYVE